MTRVKLVVLDLDDTLFLERSYVESGFRAAAQHLQTQLGAEGFFEVAWKLFETGHRGDTFNRALLSLGLEDTTARVRELVDVYRHHPPEIALLDDASEFLTSCQARHKTALVTDGATVSQRAKISALSLDEQLDHIVVTDEHGPDWRKPGTAAFAHLERRFHERGADVIYIGDNPRKDFIGPRSLGWQTLRIRRPGGLHELISTATDADREASELSVEAIG